MLFVVVSYDIPDNRRRLKVANLLLDFGGERVQLSVFDCHITQANLDRLHQRIDRVIKIEEDSVRFYILCANCRNRVVLKGLAQPSTEPGLRII